VRKRPFPNWFQGEEKGDEHVACQILKEVRVGELGVVLSDIKKEI
jgi:hypothetical protein